MPIFWMGLVFRKIDMNNQSIIHRIFSNAVSTLEFI
jgi:hypothetical protein